MATRVVEAPAGAFRGVMREHDVAFLCIRYAEAPVGDLRFCAPVRARRREETTDATRLPPACPGLPPDVGGPIVLPEEPVDEDCLFLSLYTPAADNRRRPVLVWIHGGAFVTGSGRLFDGRPWCTEQDVVVVSMNYRLGPFGFLYLDHLDPTLAGSANNGLRDQIVALEWVRDNVGSFGGDPDNVTIFGESAGGGSVCALLACPTAEGLFRRAVAQSPGGPPPRLEPEAWSAYTNFGITNLGGEPARDGLERLRAASPGELLGAFGLDGEAPPSPDDPRDFPAVPLPGVVTMPFPGPVVDGVVLTAQPADAVRRRGRNATPLVLGTCRNEGTLLPIIVGKREYDEREARDAFAAAGVDPDRALAVYERVAPGSTPRGKLVHAITETVFRNYVLDLAAAMEEAGAPVRLYLVTIETDHYDGKLGATHGIDFVFQWDLFHDPYFAKFAGTGAPRELGRTIRALWAEFARAGQPRLRDGSDWSLWSRPARPTLILDRDVRVELDPDRETRELWGR